MRSIKVWVLLSVLLAFAFLIPYLSACVSNGDCQPEEECNVQGECIISLTMGCTSNADCNTGFFCDVGSGQCLSSSCTPHSPPTLTGVCGSSQCGTATNGTCGEISCGTCGSGFICNSGTCEAVECASDSECSANQQCISGSCVNNPPSNPITCSNPSQTILRISAETNAHGEVFNGAGDYTTVICYDALFNAIGDGNRSCSGTNKVVGLSASTNAHAQAQNATGYSTDICYGDMICTTRIGNCLTGEKLVLGLSADTNAHLSITNSIENICCTVGPPPPGACTLTSASWSVANAVEGNSVSLNVQGTNCDGKTVSFGIWEADALEDDNVTLNATNVVFSGNIATGHWTAEYQDDGVGDPEYYFIADVTGIGSIKSGNPGAIEELSVSQNDNPIICQDIVTCNNYGDQPSCQADECAVADESVPGSSDCSDPGVDCSCVWDDSISSCDGATTDLGFCGDGTINPGEACDGNNWGEITACSNFGLNGTGLSCDPTTCNFDTSACTGLTGICGDNAINPGETCDGTTFSPLVDVCTKLDTFTGGALACGAPNAGDGIACQIDTVECTGGQGDIKVGQCVYHEQDTTDNCDDGFLTVDWIIEWVWDPICNVDPNCKMTNDAKRLECVNGPTSRATDCPAEIPLPFFGFYNFVIALTSVGLIYWVLSLRKR